MASWFWAAAWWSAERLYLSRRSAAPRRSNHSTAPSRPRFEAMISGV